ncbi:MAG: nucleotide exchange factor GrpE [Bacteroidota bacterium]|nr:nucleotide exchange factor GrpE [Bacteroidota bacterium]
MNTQENTKNTEEEAVADVDSQQTSEKEPDNEPSEIDSTTQLEAALLESKDKYLRLYADFENFRRRTSKEKIELIATANEQLMLALLPIIDDMDRAKISIDAAEDKKALIEGLDLIFNKFKKTLETKGLKPLESKGVPFNPDLHEAITQIPAPEESLKGKVVDEIEKGYYLHEKLIRVAKVVIGN